MDYKFVLWGYGKRGKRFLNACNKNQVIAIIDINYEQLNKEEEYNIISYEIYKEKYSSYDIVIANESCEEIVAVLEKDEINTYHILSDCPPEIMGFCKDIWIDDLPISIDMSGKYLIYGLNLYAFLLRDLLKERYSMDVDIIPDSNNKKRVNAFKLKYNFIKDDYYDDYMVLIASRFETTKIPMNKQYDVYDFLYKIEKYKNMEMLKYKNIHEGEKCFIVGTGPSLSVDDLDILYNSGYRTFSMNRVYMCFDKTKWRPDYYIVTDPIVLDKYIEDIRKCDMPCKFLCDCGSGDLSDDLVNFHGSLIEIMPNPPKFSEDICYGAYMGRTVSYVCIQFAVYMGFKEIYLIGMDHNYTGSAIQADNHFVEKYYEGLSKTNEYLKEKTELAFQKAREYAEEHGVKIYNATRGGKLEVFERVDFDSLFPK